MPNLFKDLIPATMATIAIDNVSKTYPTALPTVVTVTAGHPFTTGDRVFIKGVSWENPVHQPGPTGGLLLEPAPNVNGVFYVNVTSPTTFELFSDPGLAVPVIGVVDVVPFPTGEAAFTVFPAITVDDMEEGKTIVSDGDQIRNFELQIADDGQFLPFYTFGLSLRPNGMISPTAFHITVTTKKMRMVRIDTSQDPNVNNTGTPLVQIGAKAA